MAAYTLYTFVAGGNTFEYPIYGPHLQIMNNIKKSKMFQ